MAGMDDLNALLEQLKKSRSPLSSLLGGASPPDVSEVFRRLQEKMPDLQAKIEAGLKEVQADADALLKRMRGEEVESDKEKEGDLDTVPDRFESEHAPKEEDVLGLVQLLRQVVEPEQPPPPNPKARR